MSVMTIEQLENLKQLGRRAVACRRWRWMPGMVTETGIRVLRRDTDGYTIGYGPRTSYCIMEVTSDALPDLRDPATMGGLLALVREAWGDSVYLLPDAGWYVKGARLKNGSTISLGICADTEAAALVAALEAAP